MINSLPGPNSVDKAGPEPNVVVALAFGYGGLVQDLIDLAQHVLLCQELKG